MQDCLLQFEVENDIEILYACEAGSRAWGIESSKSDYDIRFIYRYKDLKKYLTLTKQPDTLDLQSPFDITGYDLFKTFHLMLKSNPSIYELAFSSIIYIDKLGFSQKLRDRIMNGYSIYSLIMHYRSLKKRNVKEVSKGTFDLKSQKKLIQAFRADMLIVGMRELKKVESPFDYMASVEKLDHEKWHLYQTITEAKKKNRLISTSLLNKILQLLADSSNIESSFEKQNRSESFKRELDRWLWELLGLI